VDPTHSLSIGHLIRADVAAVFAAWLDVSQLKIWMKPRPEVQTDAIADVRVGGRFRITMRSGAHVEIHDGTYTQIDQPHTLRFSWSSRPAGEETTVDLSFLAVNGSGKTMLLLKHDRLKNQTALENHREGWRRMLDRLAETLERRP